MGSVGQQTMTLDRDQTRSPCKLLTLALKVRRRARL